MSAILYKIFSKKRTIYCFILFSSLSSISYSQNLVTNPSFETAGWAQANSGSADWVTGPTNVFGTENARTGTRFMGESMGRSPAGGTTDFREYIKSPLTAALVPGNTYECSIWVSLSENYGSYACNSIGFVTTNFNPYYAFSNAPIPLTPVYATPTIMTNKVGWSQVFGTFVATSADTWVIVGNFNTQSGASWTFVGPASSYYYGYYFMDDVCIGPPGACGLILPIELLSFDAKPAGREVELNWKTSTELHCNYFKIERSTDGKSFEEIGRVNGNGNSNTEINYNFTDKSPVFGQTNYYRLREYDTDGKSFFSNIIAIEPKGDLNIYVNIYPVPTNRELTIECNGNNFTSTLTIYNSQGDIILQNEFEGHYKKEISNLQPGNYLAVLLNSEGKTLTKKFIVTE